MLFGKGPVELVDIRNVLFVCFSCNIKQPVEVSFYCVNTGIDSCQTSLLEIRQRNY